MDVRRAGGLADVRVGLEGADGRSDVAGRKRALVLADDVGRPEVAIGLQYGGRLACRPVNGQVL
jgi:hypothetical protein